MTEIKKLKDAIDCRSEEYMNVLIKYNNVEFLVEINKNEIKEKKHIKTDLYELDLENYYQIANNYCIKLNYDYMYKFNQNNFYIRTFANWKKVKHEDAPKRVADFVSDYRSAYYYSEEGVYRMSDHWGHDISTCCWLLDGSSYVGDVAVGFCKWEHFTQRETEFDIYKGFKGKSFDYYKEKYSFLKE